jgi:hypothetical protein
MPRGGARPGAGRKKIGTYPAIEVGPIAYQDGETPAGMAQRVMTEQLPNLLRVALIKALKEGETRMLIHCFDRLLGSPVQPIDLEVSRAAAKLAAATGADAEFLIRRAQQLAAENSEAVTG